MARCWQIETILSTADKFMDGLDSRFRTSIDGDEMEVRDYGKDIISRLATAKSAFPEQLASLAKLETETDRAILDWQTVRTELLRASWDIMPAEVKDGLLSA
jgi:hypothetical protein